MEGLQYSSVSFFRESGKMKNRIWDKGHVYWYFPGPGSVLQEKKISPYRIFLWEKSPEIKRVLHMGHPFMIEIVLSNYIMCYYQTLYMGE